MSSEKGGMANQDCHCSVDRPEHQAAEEVVRCQRCGAEWHSSAAAAAMLADGWKCLRCGEPLEATPRPPAAPGP